MHLQGGTMSAHASRRWVVVGLLVLWLAGFSTRPATLGADSSPAFSGQATVVRATLPVAGTIVLSDTGPLPQSGGALEASRTAIRASSLMLPQIVLAPR